MVLSDKDIVRELLNGSIIITPLMRVKKQIGSSSIDVRLINAANSNILTKGCLTKCDCIQAISLNFLFCDSIACRYLMFPVTSTAITNR